MFIITSIVSFCASFLASIGVGGGGLLIIYLLFILKIPQIESQGINLIFFIVATLCALPFHIFKNRIHYYYAIIFALFGIIGAYFGCLITVSNIKNYIGYIFGLFLLITGFYSLINSLKQIFSKKMNRNSIKEQ